MRSLRGSTRSRPTRSGRIRRRCGAPAAPRHSAPAAPLSDLVSFVAEAAERRPVLRVLDDAVDGDVGGVDGSCARQVPFGSGVHGSRGRSRVPRRSAVWVGARSGTAAARVGDGLDGPGPGGDHADVVDAQLGERPAAFDERRGRLARGRGGWRWSSRSPGKGGRSPVQSSSSTPELVRGRWRRRQGCRRRCTCRRSGRPAAACGVRRCRRSGSADAAGTPSAGSCTGAPSW